MNSNFLVEAELGRLDWGKMQCSHGPATKVPEAIRELLAAGNPQEADRAYWKLENVVVVQGQLFESALYVVPVILAALIETERPRFVRISLQGLLFEIVNGSPHAEEEARGFGDLGERCKDAARQGLWLLYRNLYEAEFESNGYLLYILEPEK